MQRKLKEHPIKWKRHLKKAALKAASMATSKYSTLERSLELTVIGAKQRCTNQKNIAYCDYGGRGIEFRFESVEQGIRWVAANLGARSSKEHSIDRIDNNGHYEPGNLKWSTRQEQARNKRAYRGSVYGNRMKKLLLARPDYRYEGLRRYVIAGWTDDQIINMKKPPGGRPRSTGPTKYTRGKLV